MGGSSVSKNVLNKTLGFIVKLLNDNNIKNWFIGYGTLLGIVRDDSCIDGDDDVDIIVDKSNYNIIENLLTQQNITFWDFNNDNFLKTN
jgi:phosphorylcholine metabolism protein LicD